MLICTQSSGHMRQLGVSLIEVMVSIVIASIALLALAGVNASAVRYTKMSQYRAVAAQLAGDIGERMRANKGAVASVGPPAVAASGFFAGAYDYVQTFAVQAAVPTLPVQQCNTAVSNCSAAEIAALDLAQWRLNVRGHLPEGSVFVIRQAVEVAADVWVVWRDPAVASTDEAPATAGECPAALTTGGDLSIRCSFFRINL